MIKKHLYFKTGALFLMLLFPVLSDIPQDARDKAGFYCQDFTEKDWGKRVVEETGNTFIRLVAQPGSDVQVLRTFKLPNAKKSYTLSMRVRHTDVVAGSPAWRTGAIVMHCLDAGGNRLSPDVKPIQFKGSSEGWVEVTREILCPEGTTSFQFMPGFFSAASGTLDIDDILFTENPE